MHLVLLAAVFEPSRTVGTRCSFPPLIFAVAQQRYFKQQLLNVLRCDGNFTHTAPSSRAVFVKCVVFASETNENEQTMDNRCFLSRLTEKIIYETIALYSY
jgi:hypothetical protein